MAIHGVNTDDSQPSTEPPTNAPTKGQEAVDDPSGYPSTLKFRVEDIYLADISGPALHLGANTASADIVATNINVDGAAYGIIADGVRVTVKDSDIVADQPFGVVNGGKIETQNTKTGNNADPTVPGTVPTSPEQAAGENTQL